MNHLDKAMEHAAASAEWQSKVSKTGYSPDNAHASAQADTHRQQAIMHGLIAIAQALTTQDAPKRRVHQVYVDNIDVEAVEAWMLKNGREVESKETPVPVDAIRRYWNNSTMWVHMEGTATQEDRATELVIEAWLKSLEPHA